MDLRGGVVWGPYGDNPFISPPFLIRGGVVWGPYGDNPFISHLRPLTPALYKWKGYPPFIKGLGPMPKGIALKA